MLSSTGTGLTSARAKESFTFRVFSRNKEIATSLITEARDMAVPEDGKLEIRVASWAQWRTGTRIKPRDLESVILAGDKVVEIAAVIKEFLDSRDWYEKVGVPYRLSFLFKGPPGNGKTTAAKALGGYFGMNIHVLVLSDPDLNDNKITELLSNVPEGSIVLLEDIDCAFNQRNRVGKDGGLTFSGLLNAIDGVASSEGRILIMTTNHVENLDSALIRPGRADKHYTFGNATGEQATKLYNRFFPGNVKMGEEFGKLVPNEVYSMAVLQCYLMSYRHQPYEAVVNIAKIADIQANMIPLPPESPPEPDSVSLSEKSED
jgi:chaperone BCS1